MALEQYNMSNYYFYYQYFVLYLEKWHFSNFSEPAQAKITL